LIVAAGGKAYPTLGSRGELFASLKSLGHSITPLTPALAPVTCEMSPWKALIGLRFDARTSLFENNSLLVETTGNLILTEWGLNGPAVMDLSHLVSAQPGAAWELSLNLLAFFQDDFERALTQQRATSMPLRVFLGGFFPPKIAQVYLKQARLAEDLPLKQVDGSALQRLVEKLKDTRLAVQGVRDFEYCQVSAGGVPVAEADPRTLESRRVPGLFLTGETLDVVGPCGGYNLQYAFSSGALAGRAAAGGPDRAL
jgi:predicted Rossmann fold flavoprotein